jgi:hypothetical protein
MINKLCVDREMVFLQAGVALVQCFNVDRHQDHRMSRPKSIRDRFEIVENHKFLVRLLESRC